MSGARDDNSADERESTAYESDDDVPGGPAEALLEQDERRDATLALETQEAEQDARNVSRESYRTATILRD
jgi:hypothetical protein